MRPAAQACPATIAAIEQMRGTLLVARALVESGRQIDLSGLDTGTAALCAAIAMLPPEGARPLRPALLALLAEVEGLGTALAQIAGGRERPDT